MAPMNGAGCPVCGRPVDVATHPCLACAGAPPPQRATVLWGEYGGVLRSAILALKHGGRDDLARPLGARMAARISLEPWAGGIDTVTWVPTHPLRLLRRGWAAAQLLAIEVARALGRPLANLLRRTGLRRQTGRTRAQRLALPAAALKVRRRRLHEHVLVVDDVTTTGATLRRAAAALANAGAASVCCAALGFAPDARSIR